MQKIVEGETLQIPLIKGILGHVPQINTQRISLCRQFKYWTNKYRYENKLKSNVQLNLIVNINGKFYGLKIQNEAVFLLTGLLLYLKKNQKFIFTTAEKYVVKSCI